MIKSSLSDYVDRVFPHTRSGLPIDKAGKACATSKSRDWRLSIISQWCHSEVTQTSTLFFGIEYQGRN